MLIESIVFFISLIGYSIVIPQILNALSTENINSISADLLLILLFISIVSLFYSIIVFSICILVTNIIASIIYSSILYLQFQKKYINFR